MKIPKTVKIGGHIVSVVLKELREGLDGEADTAKNTISIDKNLPPSQMEVTLIHEALHMMNATWGETQMGHIVLESFSQQVYQFLSDNKLLRK